MSKRLSVRSKRQSTQRLNDEEENKSIPKEHTPQNANRGKKSEKERGISLITPETLEIPTDTRKDGKTPVTASFQSPLQAAEEEDAKKTRAERNKKTEKVSLSTTHRARDSLSRTNKDEDEDPHQLKSSPYEHSKFDMKDSKQRKDNYESDCLMIGIDFGTT
jgi:hypothetical protein